MQTMNGKDEGQDEAKVETPEESKERLRRYYRQAPDLSAMRIRKRNFIKGD